MQLPENLQHGISELLGQTGLNELREAREDLTDRYRSTQTKRRLITTDQQRLSYLATRLPATYAVIYRVLSHIKERIGNTVIDSLLDLGAGPGTVLWAANQIFPLNSATLFEKDRALIQLGQQLAEHGQQPIFEKSQWEMGDLEKLDTLPTHDLVTLSYSVNELSPSSLPHLLQTCWRATKEILVVIEPGTPAGFERIRLIRQNLIDWGGHIVAPCPHSKGCPMSEGDWCHFAARVERSASHRYLKGGTLNYEDEKFSYIAISKTPYEFPKSRILRYPQHRSGHSLFTLCTSEGTKQEKTISKRTPQEYKIAKKLDWGAIFIF
jgi:ribosomal protein RSM22 (predicted rRNA methylase)